jgi:hypothetical protein
MHFNQALQQQKQSLLVTNRRGGGPANRLGELREELGGVLQPALYTR